jgi:hypothetical protein
MRACAGPIPSGPKQTSANSNHSLFIIKTEIEER